MGDKNILLLLDRMEFCALNSTVLSYVKNMDRNKFHFDILVAANQLGVWRSSLAMKDAMYFVYVRVLPIENLKLNLQNSFRKEINTMLYILF